jgi:thymidylate synthase ThyX
MKRVLNSGSIKLTNILGSEQQILERFTCTLPPNSLEEDVIKFLFSNNPRSFSQVLFTFEIKAPISLLSIWHKSKLGTINEYGQLHINEVYIPPFFYKRDNEGFTQLESKDCNDLFTKFNNYYTASINFFQKLLERGLCKEQAQMVLPAGLFATFTWIVDSKDLMTFIEKNNRISPEMYSYCETLMIYLKEQMPKVTEWVQQNKPII